MSDRIRGIVLLIAGFLMVVAGPPLMLNDGRRKAEMVKALRAEGKKAPARVVQVNQNIRRSDKVTYSFEVDGETVEKAEEASRELTDRAQAQGSLEVTYIPRDPQVATVDFARLERSAQNLTGLGPCGLPPGFEVA